jgi:hypothetical protein
MNEPDLRYAPSETCPGPAYSSLKQIDTSYCVLRPAQAFYFLALTAYLDPDARLGTTSWCGGAWSSYSIS